MGQLPVRGFADDLACMPSRRRCQRPVFEQGAVDVGKAGPGAGYLLTAAYPYLLLDQAIETAPR